MLLLAVARGLGLVPHLAEHAASAAASFADRRGYSTAALGTGHATAALAPRLPPATIGARLLDLAEAPCSS